MAAMMDDQQRLVVPPPRLKTFLVPRFTHCRLRTWAFLP